jgi:hypothetical protein
VALVAACLLGPRAGADTVQEQRARLPPPAECADLVEGVWRSHDYNHTRSKWTVFTLEVRRVDDTDELTGSITNRSWYGPVEESEPGPCRGQLQYTVSMEARGTVEGRWVEFGGTSWELDENPCGYLSGYYLDNFSGEIDLDLQEFQSVNNDGGPSVNYPTVFRRIRCFDPEPDPNIEVAAPAFFPEIDDGGCSVAGRR